MVQNKLVTITNLFEGKEIKSIWDNKSVLYEMTWKGHETIKNGDD